MGKHVPQIITGVVGLGLVAAGVYLIATGQTVYGVALISGGLGTLGLPRIGEPHARDDDRDLRPPGFARHAAARREPPAEPPPGAP